MNDNTETTKPIIQHRVMRTYEVSLVPDGETAPVAATLLNLSYELDEALNAIDRNGTVVLPADIPAKIEVAKRLRKLVNKGSIADITPEMLDDDNLTWDTRMLTATFVEVACDSTGRPIPRNA